MAGTTATARGTAIGWFATAIVAAFGVGLLAGLVLPRAVAAFAPDPDPATDPFVMRMIRTYELDADQQAVLRAIEKARRLERERVYEEELGPGAALPDRVREQIEARLAEVNDTANRRIVHILDPEQRDEWLRDSRPLPIGEPDTPDDGGR